MIYPKKNIIGSTFHSLTVLKQEEDYVSPRGVRAVRYLCECVCGNKTIVNSGNLKNGQTKTCGCLKSELQKPYGYHFKYPSLDKKYNTAKSRCNNPKNSHYKHYGGRGIKFLFKESFVDFVDYCLSIGWKEGLEMDRIDNNGNYEPGNIRFVTRRENVLNRRNTLFLEAFGERKALSFWVNDPRCLTSYKNLFRRVKNGWPHELALTTKKGVHLTSVV